MALTGDGGSACDGGSGAAADGAGVPFVSRCVRIFTTSPASVIPQARAEIICGGRDSIKPLCKPRNAVVLGFSQTERGYRAPS